MATWSVVFVHIGYARTTVVLSLGRYQWLLHLTCYKHGRHCWSWQYVTFTMSITSPQSNLRRARRKSPIGYNGMPQIHPQNCPFPFNNHHPYLIHPSLDRPHSPPQTASRSNQLFCHNTLSGHTHKQTDRQTSHMAQCVTFAVARIRVKGRNFAYFSLWHRKYGK